MNSLKTLFTTTFVVLLLFACQQNEEYIAPEELQYISIHNSAELQRIKSRLLENAATSNGRNQENTDLIESADWTKVSKIENEEHHYTSYGLLAESSHGIQNLLVFKKGEELTSFLFSFNPSEDWINYDETRTYAPLDGDVTITSLTTGKAWSNNSSLIDKPSNGRSAGDICCYTYKIAINNNYIENDGTVVVVPTTYENVTICSPCGVSSGDGDDSVIPSGGGGGSSGGNNGGDTTEDEDDSEITVILDQICAIGFKKDENGVCVREDCDTSVEDLKEAFPDASDLTLSALAEKINQYGKDFGIDSQEKMQHFLAQAGHESTNYAGVEFGVFEENLNYRWEKLGTDYWSKYFNPISNPTLDPDKEDPREYKRSSTSNYVNSQKFSNYVYNDANRSARGALGNTNPGDGYKFRGRGIIQLTGRSNYETFNTFYQANYNSSINLLSNPDLVSSNMDIAVISALWFFKNNVLNKVNFDGNTSINEVTKRVNGGLNGLEHRQELLNQTKTNIDCI